MIKRKRSKWRWWGWWWWRDGEDESEDDELHEGEDKNEVDENLFELHLDRDTERANSRCEELFVVGIKFPNAKVVRIVIAKYSVMNWQ